MLLMNSSGRFTGPIASNLCSAEDTTATQDGTAHACGTLVTGIDPRTSAVDSTGRVHGLQGLTVADGSVLPRSSRVNPALTIYAWSLRAAERLARRLRAAGAETSTGGAIERAAAAARHDAALVS